MVVLRGMSVGDTGVVGETLYSLQDGQGASSCVSVCARAGVWWGAGASPGLAMLRRMAARSFLFHFCISSSILSMRARFRAHRHPLREEPLILFSTFSKHLFRDRLCLTEFFQPSGAV